MKPNVVAEVGCNHMGDMKIAFKMIEVAAHCGVDVVKFQKRNVRECLSEGQYNAPHQNPWQSFGMTYGQHREALEFTWGQHGRLKAECENHGVTYSTSVWDVTSAREIIQLNPALIKVPSACNTNMVLQEVLRDEYTGDVHISLGMTTRDEAEGIYTFWKPQRDRLVLYACTSGYPVKMEESFLLEIPDLGIRFPGVRYGYSGHHLGIALDIAAYTLGAEWIERHFTLDRTMKGTDHAASLEPHGLERLVRDLEAVETALQYKPNILIETEQIQREKLKCQLPY